MNFMELPNIPFWALVYLQNDAPYMTAPFSLRHFAKPSKAPGFLEFAKLKPIPAIIKTAIMEETEIKMSFLLLIFLSIDSSFLCSVLWLSCLSFPASSLLNAILVKRLRLAQKYLKALHYLNWQLSIRRQH